MKVNGHIRGFSVAMTIWGVNGIACASDRVAEQCEKDVADKIHSACLAYGCDVIYVVGGKTMVGVDVQRDAVPHGTIEDQVACSIACTHCGGPDDAPDAVAGGNGGTRSSNAPGASGGAAVQVGTGGGLNGTSGARTSPVDAGTDRHVPSPQQPADPGHIYSPCSTDADGHSACVSGQPMRRADSDVCVCTTTCTTARDCPVPAEELGSPFCLVGSTSSVGRCFVRCDPHDALGSCPEGLSCDFVGNANLCFQVAM